MNTDGLPSDSLAEGKYVVRLGRAAAVLGLGVLMHLPSPGVPGALPPDVAPRPFVRVNAQQADSSDAPAVIVTHSLVYAGSASVTGVLEASGRATEAPVGTAGNESSRPLALAEIEPPSSRASDPVVDATPSERASTTALAEERPAPTAVRPAPTVAAPPANDSPPPAPEAVATSAMNVTAPPLTRVHPGVTSVAVSEEELVRQLLDEYTGAFERRDVRAQKALYPNVDGKALKRAYEQITSQRLTLESCGITISGSTANARCRGSATFQPRIGTRPVQIASREWTFDLSKEDTSWRIVKMR